MPVSAKRITEIADEEIDLVLENEKHLVDTLYGEGGFVGDIVLPANQRLAKYWSVTQMPDVLMLVEPHWEDWIRGGEALYGELARPPVSLFWLNLLREPGLFKETAADFVRLNTADQKRKAGEGEVAQSSGPAPAPQPAGNSLPLSMAPAAGPPQPGPGGNPGGAGSYPMGMT